jgi:hypothetical protein
LLGRHDREETTDLTCLSRQTHPHEWEVITKQLARSKHFRKFQAAKRDNFFNYAQQVQVELGMKHGFKLPPSFRTREGGLKEEPSRQGRLASWIEYLFYEYDRLTRYSHSMSKCEPQFLEAWAKLARSQTLSGTEARLQSPSNHAIPPASKTPTASGKSGLSFN